MNNQNIKGNLVKKSLNNSKVSFSNENIYISDDGTQHTSFKKSISKKSMNNSSNSLTKSKSNDNIGNSNSSADFYLNKNSSSKTSLNLNGQNISKNKLNNRHNLSSDDLLNINKNKKTTISNSKESLGRQDRKFVSKNQNTKNVIKPKANIPDKIARSKNDLKKNKKPVVASSLRKSTSSNLNVSNNSLSISNRKLQLNRSNLSLNSTNLSTKNSSNFSLNSVKSERKNLKETTFTRPKLKLVTNFINEWNYQMKLFKNIQIGLLISDILVTICNISIAIWINIDQRFLFLANIGNQLKYTSLYRLIGLFPYLYLAVSSLSLLVDLFQLFHFLYIKNYLYSHDETKLKKIIDNQQILNSLSNDVNKQNKYLRLKVKINHDLKISMRSIKSIYYMLLLISLLVIIAFQYFIGLYIHFNLDMILSYQIPQTLIKLIREYEKQVLSVLGLMNILVKIRSVSTNTLEEKLVDKMHIQFDCCNYQNPYQYGDYAPPSCNFERGCLNPIQDFAWDYFFIGVIILLSTASIKTLLKLIGFINFRVILIKRLIYKLYDFDVKSYKSEFSRSKEQLNINEQLERLCNVDSSESDSDIESKKQRLEEIRRQKEELLAKEDEEEEKERQKAEYELKLQDQQERLQKRYEEMLAKQNRIEELKYQQLQRKIQMHHLMTNDSDPE